jgi:Ca2+-transporting ATPase
MRQTENPWHSLTIKEIYKILSSSATGLTEKEAELRQRKFGKNVLGQEENLRLIKLLIQQIKSPLVFILIIAGFVTLFLKAYTDAAVILFAVLINTIVGVVQEGKASKAFLKLKLSQKTHAVVLRDGHKKQIDSEELVPGDVLILQQGERVPADARLLEQKNLQVNESVLTGEWLAVSKSTKRLAEKTSLPERSNMIWMGTFVADGWAKAIVVNTGASAEIGKIAEIIKKEKPVLTPFQKNVKKLAKFLGLLVLVALFFIFIGGILRGHSVFEMFFTSVAVAVAAIPEGLPVVVTVILAVGMERILSKGGLVKKLYAAEALGSVEVILTDKTGTLTQGIMRVSNVITLSSLKNNIFKKADVIADRLNVLKMAILTSNAFIEGSENKTSDWIVRGRAIEGALLVAGLEHGFSQDWLLKKQPRLDFLPFDSQRRFAASLHNNFLYVSGAPEYILKSCSFVYRRGRVVKLSSLSKPKLKKALDRETAYGNRVIAVAYKKTKLKEVPRGESENDLLSNLVFAGFIVFHDPLRPGVSKIILKTQKAGIRTVMVTGDHKKTAKKIAEETGIYRAGDKIVEGDELESFSESKLKEIIRESSVFARILPRQKLKLVQAWQSQGKVVAMTGDGVNDAPALKRAEIGVALESGTEIAKEASGLILLNNSFDTIFEAIIEGRRILTNLRKVLTYLLATGVSEIILIGCAIAANWPLPILPVQILWANLIEEGFMTFAFVFEPREKGIVNTSPNVFLTKHLLTSGVRKIIVVMSFVSSILLILLFLILNFALGYQIEHTRSIVFAALSLDSIFFAFSLKNFRKPIWKINIFSNPYLISAMLISLTFLSAALFIPAARTLLSLEPLSGSEIFLVFVIGLFNLIAVELIKYFLIQKPLKH